MIRCKIFNALIFLFIAGYISAAPVMRLGSIQFPKALTTIPSVPMYYAGMKLKSDVDAALHKTTYSIMSDTQQTRFFALFTTSVSFGSFENTVQYLKVRTHQPYKLFQITLEQKPENNDVMWHVQQLALDHTQDNRIPDETVIMYINPEFVSHLEGGNRIELPRVIIADDIIARSGSESILMENANQMVLASMELNTIHSAPKHEVKQNAKTIIALTA